MNDMQQQLAKLAVSIFSANVDAAGGVAQAARQIFPIYFALSDLATLCKDWDARRDNTALEYATTQLENLLRRTGRLEYTYGGEQSLVLDDIYRRISWKKVQILSHELRFCAADLKTRKHRENGTRVDARDADTLATSGEAIQALHYDLQQLEQQAAQESAHVVVPILAIPDQPETTFVNSICAQCKILQQEIDSTNARLEKYKMKEANDFLEAGDYENATTVYEQLSRTRELEISRKLRIGDKDGVDDAERVALKIKYKTAIMLVKRGKLPEAEIALDHVWQRRRAILPKNHTDTNLAQRQLCLVLRAQHSKPKYQRAGKLYDNIWSDPDLEPEDVWVMENGHELGMVYIEQGSFLRAEAQLGDVLAARRNALGEQNQATVETAAQLAALIAERGRAKESADLLRPLLASGVTIFSAEALKCAAAVGEKLFELGEYADTEGICRMIWNDAKQMVGARPPEAISAGWHLSLALYFKNQETKYEEAKVILDSLLQTPPGEVIDPSRSLRIRCLLSWVCRKVSDFDKADEFARSVWERKRNEDLLGPLFSSTGVNRIWLLSRNRKNEKDCDRKTLNKEAREVWNEVLASTKALTISRNEAKSLAKCWRDLAKELDYFAKKRDTSGSNLAKTILKEATDLEIRRK